MYESQYLWPSRNKIHGSAERQEGFYEFGMAALLREELNSHKNLYTLPITVCSVYIFSCRK